MACERQGNTKTARWLGLDLVERSGGSSAWKIDSDKQHPHGTYKGTRTRISILCPNELIPNPVEEREKMISKGK